MPNIIYREEDLNDLNELANSNIILLVTATDLETSELHKRIKPIDNFEQIIRFHEGAFTYYLGVLGRYKIIHVQCSMGSLSRDSSIITVTEAIRVTNPRAVIMPGIAFGVDIKKQRIGDVIVAEAVQPYNNKRVGEREETQRAYATPSSKILLNRVKNLRSWEFLIEDDQKAKMIPALLLSGEELIDNKIYRDALVDKYPTAAGGEMEGAGVYAACDGKVDCILIKGICDFADGEKGKNKETNQTVAMGAALSICEELFSSKTAFKELNVIPFQQVTNIDDSEEQINDVLFELYDLTKEPYYVERNEDAEFVSAINQYGIWVFGPSGYGKSNLITRNLLHHGIEFIQVNLATCYGISIESFFTEILFDLSGKIEGVYSQVQPKSFVDCSKQILLLLEKHYTQKDLVLFIEEIPIDSNDEHKEFAQRIYSLLASKVLMSSLNKVKIVLSSINDPTKHIQTFNQKIHQYLKFIHLDKWHKNNILRLISNINSGLKIKIDPSILDELVTKSNMSPRFIKKFYRNLFIMKEIDNLNIKNAILETERELNQMQNA